MQPQTTDIDPLPHPWRNLLPLTGLTIGQVHTVYILTHQRLPPRTSRPRGSPLPVRVGLVLIHLPTNLTTRARAAVFDTSQSSVDPIIHHLVPVPAHARRPAADHSTYPRIIDGTLIPVHDQSITAISKNYRRSVNAQIITCAHRRRVLVARRCWPGNRNDVIVAPPHRRADAHRPPDPRRRRHRAIPTITTPRRDTTGHIIRDDHYRAHRRVRAHVEHVIARLKDWQILRQCRRRDNAINHSLQIIAGLWNLKTHNQLRVNLARTRRRPRSRWVPAAPAQVHDRAIRQSRVQGPPRRAWVLAPWRIA